MPHALELGKSIGNVEFRQAWCGSRLVRSIQLHKPLRQRHFHPLPLNVQPPQITLSKRNQHLAPLPMYHQQGCRPGSLIHILNLTDNHSVRPSHIHKHTPNQIADVDLILTQPRPFGRARIATTNPANFSASEIESTPEKCNTMPPLCSQCATSSTSRAADAPASCPSSGRAAPSCGNSQSRFRSANFSGKSVRISAKTSPLRPLGPTNPREPHP
jgi:hypothetical protein